MDCTLPKGFHTLARALKRAMGPGKSQGRIRLEATEGTLQVAAGGGNLTLSVELQAEGSLLPCLVPGEDFLKAIKGAKAFTLAADGRLVTAAGSVALELGDPAGFPMPAPSGGTPITTLGLAPEVVAYAASAASSDPTRPSLSSVLIDLSQEGIARLISTDGFRLAVAESASRGKTIPPTMLPKEAFTVLQDLPLGAVKVLAAKDEITFRGAGWFLTAVVRPGTFPDYRKVTPPLDSLDRVFRFDSQDLLAGVRQAAKVADPYNRNLRLLLSDGRAALILNHGDGPVGSAVVPCQTAAEPMVVAFNHLYLEGALRTGGSEVTFRAKDGVGVAVWDTGSVGPWSLRTYIMPVRFSMDEAMDSDAILRTIAERAGAPVASLDGFTCRGDLQVLGKVAALAARPARLPILQRVKLEGTPQGLIASASNLDLYLTVRLAGEGQQAPVLIEGKLLREALKGASHLTLAGDALTTQAVTHATIPAQDYPEFPEQHFRPLGPALQLDLSRDLTNFAASAASPDESKSALFRVLLDLDTPGEARLVSTDGFRLAVATGPAPKGLSGQFLLDQEAVRLVGSLTAGQGEAVTIHLPGDTEFLTFQGRNWTLTAKVTPKAYPDYRRVIPTPSSLPNRLVVERTAFRAALAVVGGKADHYHRHLEFSAEGEIARMAIENPETGRAEASIGCSVLGSCIPGLHFDYPYMKDLVAITRGNSVAFRFGGVGSTWVAEECRHGMTCQTYLLPNYPAESAPAEVSMAAGEVPLPAEAVSPMEQAALDALEALPAPGSEIAEMASAGAMNEAPAPCPVVIEGQGDKTDEFVLVWRQDSQAVRALGGREGLKAARYRVKWECKQSGGFQSWQPQAWFVPRQLLDQLDITPISEPEAMAIFHERSQRARAHRAA